MDLKLFWPNYKGCHLALLLRLVIEKYQNKYRMTYIYRSNKEKATKNAFALFDIISSYHIDLILFCCIMHPVILLYCCD